MPVGRLARLRRPSLLVNAALGVLVLGGGVWVYTIFRDDTPAGADSGTATRTVEVAQGTVTATVSSSGTVQSASTANAEFATSGTVTEIRVKVGDLVKKGQVLAVVDDAAAKRARTAAKANLTAAEAALDRAEEAGDDTTTAETEVTSAELAVEEAEEAVAGTVLKAPMAGTVVAVNGSVGGSSGGGSSGGGSSSGGSGSGSTSGGSSGSSSSFVDIADLTKLEVSAAVAEADATKLKAGQPATVTWNVLTDVTATATLASIDPNASSSNDVVTYGVVFSLENLPEGVRAGQTVEVSVEVGRAENVIYVNSVALTTVGSRHTVTVLENGQQVTRPVEVGLAGDQAVEITSGVSVGEQVVVRTSTSDSGGSPQGGFPGGGPGGANGGGFPGGGVNSGGTRSGGRG
ncbi:efflux RND transporter periplasmic adaptor subunit [Micromonospora sp. CA-263727]|uniref:efflux RND transporter periplasmic adaptor subunit n=1 Tax=Micromonospora sp. CA-263727 TaxID=3239967 RepID=UPI003D93E8E2